MISGGARPPPSSEAFVKEPILILLVALPTLLFQWIVPVATLVLAYRCFREIRELRDRLPPSR